MELIFTSTAPLPIGPYSQAIIENSFVFCSGQIAINPLTSELAPPDVRSQTIQVMENLKSVLAKAGTSLANVVKTTVFLTDMADFDIFNEVYASYFAQPFPARSCIAVSGLPKNALIEIEAVATLGFAVRNL